MLLAVYVFPTIMPIDYASFCNKILFILVEKAEIVAELSRAKRGQLSTMGKKIW